MQPVIKQAKADRVNHVNSNETTKDYAGQYFGNGGASLAGMAEQIKSNEFTGSMGFSYPLTLTESRSNTPSLTLQYQSGVGHSTYGMGFDIALAQISRRTAGTGTPKYDNSDTFSFNGKYLVPELDSKQNPISRTETINSTTYTTQTFIPREQERPVIIDLFTNQSDDSDSFWRVRQSDNTVMIFGRNATARIANPADERQVFAWLLEEVVDSKGNHQRWYYKAENTEGVNLESDSVERQRDHQTNRYLKRIAYGNSNQPAVAPYTLMSKEPSVNWLFEVVLDYGEHNVATTNINPYDDSKKRWLLRKDSFSNYRMGFEVRTHRLCQNILLFHRFDELSTGYPVLVKRWQLAYDSSQVLSLLRSITAIGSIFQPDTPEQPYREQPLPPVDLHYQQFKHQQGQFTELKPAKDSGRLPGLNYGQYQLVDLFQQGIACAVYQDKQWLYYREPTQIEKDKQGQYQLSYGELNRIKQLPAAGAKGLQLTNVTAEGEIELVNPEPGRAGFYQASGEGEWQQFVPFEAFPSEAGHRGIEFADLTGDGRGDIVLIGPHSVRFYPNKGKKGFAPAIENTNLPKDFPRTTQGNRNALFGFSDLLGSGQPHLFHILHNKVEVWPNLGHGRFGTRIDMKNPPQLDDEGFEPDGLFLADIDGSGTADIIYVDGDKAIVYLNLLGNGFAKPFEIKLPFPIDSVNQVSFADVFGCGTNALIVTVIHPDVRHYAYDFSRGNKPYLLNAVNNNKGKKINITYGSSAHEYQRDKLNKQAWVSKLPLAVQVVKKLDVTDEVNEITLGKSFTYHHGFYDFFEREYRGFAKVETFESESHVSEKNKIAPSAPLCRIDWFHNGDEHWDDYLKELQKGYYRQDKVAKNLNDSLYLNNASLSATHLETFKRDAKRSLSGMLVRSELYGMKGGLKRPHPYTVMENRYCIKLYQKPKNTAEHTNSSVQKLLLESIEYQYDENPQDPKVSQKINRQFDDYGYVTDSLAITYPRRNYDGVLHHTESQNTLWIVRNQCEYINKKETTLLLTGYKNKVINHQIEGLTLASNKPHFNFEDITESLLKASAHKVLGHAKHFYYDAEKSTVAKLGEITDQALASHTETIVYEKEHLNDLFVTDDKRFESVSELENILKDEGHYITSERDPYWWQSSSKQAYGNAEKFYLPIRITDEMGNTTTFDYDKYHLKVNKVTNAYSHSIETQWNYRCMQLAQLTDLNSNVFFYQYDAVGRLIKSSYQGKVEGKLTGFNTLSGESVAYSVRDIIANPQDMIDGAAQIQAYDDFSWMGRLNAETIMSNDSSMTSELATHLVTELVKIHWLTRDGNIRSSAHYAAKENAFHIPFTADFSLHPEQLKKIQQGIQAAQRQPTRQILVDAENYSKEEAPVKTRVALYYHDGFGRKLQEKVKVEKGQAINVDEKKDILLEEGQPKQTITDNRWLTSGRTVFNNKGLPVQKYEPYYLDSSAFLDIEELNKFGVSSTHYYDAVGRIVRLVSAKGFASKTEYHPWYQLAFDHNDNLLDSPYYQVNLTKTPDKNSPYYDELVVNHLNTKDDSPKNIKTLQGIEQRKATHSALPMVDTPTIMIFDGLNNLTSKIRLNNSVITAEQLSSIYTDEEHRKKLLALLQESGIVTSQNTLSNQFNGELSDLPDMLNFRKKEVLQFLNNQHEERKFQSYMNHNIKSQLLDEQDNRIRALGKRNCEYIFNLSKKVKSTSVDAGVHWQLENAGGQVIWQSDGRNNVLRSKYDKLNRLIQLKQQNGDKLRIRERYDYGDSLPESENTTDNNLRGRLYKRFDQTGLQIASVYGINGELIEKQIVPLKSYKQTVDWPATGDAPDLLETEQHGVTTSYNALGQQTQVVNSVPAVEPQLYTTKYQYYPSGRLAAVKHKPPQSSDEQVMLTDVEYAANGLVLKETHSGLVSEYEYEKSTLNLLRVVTKKTQGGALVRDERLSYDPAGNLVIVRDAANNDHFTHHPSAEPVSHYQYDALHRIVSAKGRKQMGLLNNRDLPQALQLQSGFKHTLHGYTQHFSYDKGHNITKVSTRGDTDQTISFLVDNSSNRSAVNPATAEQLNAMFDAQGNQIQLAGADNQQKMFWDAKNQLQKVVLVDRNGDKDDAEYYQYDHTGQRFRKVTERYSKDLNTVNVEHVLYFGEIEIRSKGRRSATTDTVELNELLHIQNLYAGSQGKSLFYRWLQGTPADQVNNHYRLTLTSASGQAQIDFTAQGELISFVEHFPFGGIAVHSTAKDSDIKLKYYRYSGKERDATGLYYYGSRYYAPWQRRWISTDPAGHIDGLNLYSFAQNNPTTYSDYNGLMFRSKKYDLTVDAKNQLTTSEDNAVKLLSFKRIADDANKKEEQKEETEKEEEKRTTAQIQARSLINDIVSAYLNATEKNLTQSKEKVFAAYKDLKALVDSKALDADQLGQSFQDVGKDIVAARSATESDRAARGQSPQKSDRYLLAREFDQLTSQVTSAEKAASVSAPISSPAPTSDFDDVVSIAGFDENLNFDSSVSDVTEDIQAESVEAIRVDIDIDNNDVNHSAKSDLPRSPSQRFSTGQAATRRSTPQAHNFDTLQGIMNYLQSDFLAW